MRNSEWPISPTFLSLRHGCTEDTANFNTDGIYYTDYIRGFLADLSHDPNIQNTLSLFQFVPKDFLPYDPNAEKSNEITTDPTKATVILNEPLDPWVTEILDRQGRKIIRIDSGTFINNGRLCDVFRKCHSEHTGFCFMQDSIVAIFADEKLNEFPPDTDEYRLRLEKLIAEFNEDRAEISKIKCDALTGHENIKRLYIHYTCPKSFFEEHFFPIYVQGHIIACLMLGQMARDAFNKEQPFPLCWKQMTKEDNKCPDYLSEIKNLDMREWDKKSRTIIERIEIFEKRLEDKIDHKNSRYINFEFAKIERTFRNKVQGINLKRENAVSQFTIALNSTLDSIKEKFDNNKDSFIRMFALPIDIHHDKLVPIGWAGAEFDVKDDFSFALNLLKDIDKFPHIEQEKIILEASSQKIRENFDVENGDIFLPGWLAGSEVAYIVWERHYKNRRESLVAFKEYKRALLDFYSVALECYSYIRGAKMELLLETTIQESAHESAHFILPAIDVVENYLEANPQNIDSFENYKAEVLESLNQLREINYGSSLIFSTDLKINKSPVPVFDLLYKLKKTLNKRALDSHKGIYYTQSENYVVANIDAKYFNHALYNLLDNAIKYGYEGSYIRINMNVDRKEGMLIVDVVSYGIKIEDDDRIYQLFERNEEAAKIARGTGIGLYIIRKICEAHGGSISHTSEFLSKYNIPVLINYKLRNTLANKNSLQEICNFEKELSRISGFLEHEVVYDPRFVKYAFVFSSSIDKPTYRNSFRVQIPLN